jgi:hypothetical protein
VADALDIVAAPAVPAMKRILTLDGGGIRGVFSLQILARIEALFRQRHRRDDLVLADVFHLFAGTSTGAIIATLLAWGMGVREIERLYVERGGEMFARVPWYGRWKSKYRAEAIAQFFQDLFRNGERGGATATLGSPRLRALLLVIMRNASTGSPWPISNNPHARFNDRSLPDCNLDIPLWQLLRASTAAPTFFPPEEIAVGPTRHVFVDGGITPFNNPSLLAVLMATLPPYRLCWPATRKALHVISVGTGGVAARLPRKLAANVHLMDQLRFVIPALLGSVSVEQDLVCRVVGDCLHGAPLDSEIGALEAPSLFPPSEQKFTYVRYDQPITAAAGEPELDDLGAIPLLQETGQRYAEQHVRDEHLEARGGAAGA